MIFDKEKGENRVSFSKNSNVLSLFSKELTSASDSTKMQTLTTLMMINNHKRINTLEGVLETERARLRFVQDRSDQLNGTVEGLKRTILMAGSKLKSYDKSLKSMLLILKLLSAQHQNKKNTNVLSIFSSLNLKNFTGALIKNASIFALLRVMMKIFWIDAAVEQFIKIVSPHSRKGKFGIKLGVMIFLFAMLRKKLNEILNILKGNKTYTMQHCKGQVIYNHTIMIRRSNHHIVSNIFKSFFSNDAKLKKRNSIGRLISFDMIHSVDIAEKTDNTNSVSKSSKRLYPIIAACTSEAYDFQLLLPFLQRNFQLFPFICNDVLHVQVEPSSRCRSGEIFFFKNGSFVFWSNGNGPQLQRRNSTDLEEEDELVMEEIRKNILPILKPFELTPFSEADFEQLSYKFTNSNTGIVDETILLNEETISVKEKLAFSNGLADSVKLGVLERMMDEHIAKVRNIPNILMNSRKIPIKRREVLALTGELLHFRAQLNLNSDLIDTPDIYWSEPKLEDLYMRVSRVLETRPRTAILNKKLDYAKEMAQVLGHHLAEVHGLKLEWGIIALIAVEVAFETFHLVEKAVNTFLKAMEYYGNRMM